MPLLSTLEAPGPIPELDMGMHAPATDFDPTTAGNIQKGNRPEYTRPPQHPLTAGGPFANLRRSR